MQNAVIQYDFFPHYYISDKNTYEMILCECINKSKKMIDLCGGKFSIIVDQHNKQPDVVSDISGYEIDFKLMISETLKEFQSRTAPIAEEIAPGVKAIYNPPSLKKKVVLLWNCCRNIDDSRLQYLRTQKDMEAKAVTHFFDKVLNTNKNILLFFPVFFSTVDKSLSSEMQYETIFNEVSSTTSYIYEYRNKFCSGFDTYVIYAINIPNQNEFTLIISQCTSNGLKIIDTVRFFSLETVQKLALENM